VAATRPETFRIPDEGAERVRVVELVPNQVVTRAETAAPVRRDGQLVADGDEDLVKLAVLERHSATGRVGLGFVRGFGLRNGAFGSTVAHDAHNIVVAGVNDDDMAGCVTRLAEIGGGLVVARGGSVVAELPLEIAGLMSTQPAQEVADRLSELEGTLREMGVRVGTPFMYLGFLALSVIPELRVTDLGIVDVRRFELVPLGAD
jgi:adenine deaminase